MDHTHTSFRFYLIDHISCIVHWRSIEWYSVQSELTRKWMITFKLHEAQSQDETRVLLQVIWKMPRNVSSSIYHLSHIRLCTSLHHVLKHHGSSYLSCYLSWYQAHSPCPPSFSTFHSSPYTISSSSPPPPSPHLHIRVQFPVLPPLWPPSAWLSTSPSFYYQAQDLEGRIVKVLGLGMLVGKRIYIGYKAFWLKEKEQDLRS